MSVVFPINPDDRFEEYTATAGQTVFSVPFPFQDDRDITIVKIAASDGAVSTLTLTTHYSLAGAGTPGPGSLTLVSVAAAGDKIRVIGSAVLDRLTSIVRDGIYSSRAQDNEHDRHRLIQQELAAGVGRAMKSDYGQAGLSIDTAAVASGKVLMRGTGDDIVAGPAADEIAGAQGYAEAAGAAQIAAEAAAASAGMLTVMSIAALKAIDQTTTSRAYLLMGNKSGPFTFLTGDYSAAVTADAMEAIYVKGDFVATTAGCWARDNSREADFEWFNGSTTASENNDELVAAEAMGVANYIDAIVVRRGAYNITTDIRPTTIILGKGGYFTRNGSAAIFYSRAIIDMGGSKNKRTANFSQRRVLEASEVVNPGIPGYYINEFAQQQRLTLTNLSGWRAIHGTGASSQAAQTYYSASHLGHGDCYSEYHGLSATETADTSGYLTWGWQKSVGAINGQVNAGSDKVNLYFDGDCVLNDGGFADVTMFGSIRFLYYDGTNSGDYNVARVGYFMKSTGVNSIDACFVASGKAFTGFDLSTGAFSSNAAITLKASQRIAWDADGVPPPGKFSTQSIGTTYTYFSGGSLIDHVGGVGIFSRGATFAQVSPGIDGVSVFRVSGASATAGFHIGQAGAVSYLTANSTGADSTTMIFRTAATGIEANRWQITPSGYLYPATDNAYQFGAASNRVSEVFAANGTINTSDERLKTSIGPIPDEWLDAWEDVEAVRYKMVEAVGRKGDAARWHIGYVAQQILSAFAKRGLDALEIGLLCHDRWDDQFEDEFSPDGEPTGKKLLTVPAGDRYSLRYDECAVFEAAYQRRELTRLRQMVKPAGEAPK